MFLDAVFNIVIPSLTQKRKKILKKLVFEGYCTLKLQLWHEKFRDQYD